MDDSPSPVSGDELALLDFLTRLTNDRAAGKTRPLVEYLELYPEHEDAIALEFLAAAQHERADPDPKEPGTEDGGFSGHIGPYRVLGELGRGGQGIVYLAEDERLARRIALKVVKRREIWRSEQALLRLQREARVAAQLDHPGIATVYDLDGDTDHIWIAMRHVRGTSLRERMQESPLPTSAEGVGELLGLLEQSARALHAAHEQGLIHRDIKPGNVMVTPAGDAVLLDFGVARDIVRGDTSLTEPGFVVGTPAYMSPEQRGELDVRPDRRTDIWSLGATFYECLTGERVYRPAEGSWAEDSKPASVMDAHRRNRAVGRDAALVVRTALARSPDHRYATAQALADDVARVLDGQSPVARPMSPARRLGYAFRTHPAATTFLLALVAALASAIGINLAMLAQLSDGLEERSGELRRMRAGNAVEKTELRKAQRIGEVQTIHDLLEEEPQLWPASPRQANDLQRWVRSAEGVLARRGTRDLWLNTLRSEASPLGEEFLLFWQEELRAAHDQLAQRIPKVRDRLAFVRALVKQAESDPTNAWKKLSRELARPSHNSPYGPIELSPQLGLLPLGRNPGTRLFEFAHLPSGTPAAINPEGHIAYPKGAGIVLVLLPGGTFTMGPSESDAARSEAPARTMTLRPFFISKHEITQEQWAEIMEFNPSAHPHPSDGSALQRRRPVETITWDEAQTYAARIGLVLPTEAQWEYACRAGSLTPWHTGRNPETLARHANLGDVLTRQILVHTTPEPGFDDGFTRTAPVGSFAPSPWGLFDFHGNVAEWCRATHLPGSQQPQDRAGKKPATADQRKWVVRGGDWMSDARAARSSTRREHAPGLRTPTVGIRLSRAIDP